MGLIEDLRQVIKGDVYGPLDPGYKDAKWTTNLDNMHEPQVIVSCKSVEDVQNSVRIAAKYDGVKVAAKSGGHGWLNFALPPNGLCVELHKYQASKTAVVQAGALSADVYAEFDKHGLAGVGGWCGAVGFGGLIPGGGWSLLSTKYGLACDNCFQIEVVLPSGEFVIASATSYPELFKALRGGGLNNFGICTAFHLNLVPFPPKIAYAFYNFNVANTYEKAVDLLKWFSDFYLARAAKYPDLTFYISLSYSLGVTQNGVKPTPTKSISIMALYFGEPKQGKHVLWDFYNELNPDNFTLTIDTYPNFIAYAGGPVREGQTYLWSEQGFLNKDISKEVAAIIVNAFNKIAEAAIEDTNFGIGFDGMGGQVRIEPPGGSSFAYRNSTFLWGMLINRNTNQISDHFTTIKLWARKLTADIVALTTAGKYVNLRTPPEDVNIQSEYYGDKLDFLVVQKQKYDPNGLLDYPQGLNSDKINASQHQL